MGVYEFSQVIYYLSLFLSSFVRCLLSSVVSLSCVICENVDDDDVVFLVSCLYDFVKCLW